MRCIVCGNTRDFKSYLKATRRHPQYWRCHGCGLVFAHPQPNITYESYPINPVDDLEMESRFLNYRMRVERCPAAFADKNARILDVGAYTGVFLKFLESQGFTNVRGIETSSSAVAYGKRRFGVDLVCSELESYETDEPYDVVTMFNVFEHVADPRASLGKVRKLLKPGGFLILELPNIHHSLCRWSAGQWHHFEIWHNWFFDYSSIKALLDSEGFSIEQFFQIGKTLPFGRLFDVFMTLIRIYDYIHRSTYLKFRETRLMKVLYSKYIVLNINDYYLLQCKYINICINAFV